MRVSISAIPFDIVGSVSIDVSDDNVSGDYVRRVNRVATLDGGVAINDRGYNEADRTLTYTWASASIVQNIAIKRMIELYSRVHVSTSEGFYLAAPESFTPDPESPSMTLLIIEKIT